MPNWCEGNIRFRGKQKDIMSFLLNEIVVSRYEKVGEHVQIVEVNPVIKDDEYSLTFSKEEGRGTFYFRKTHRNFIDRNTFEVFIEADSPEDEIIVCIDGLQVAWSFEYIDAWKEHAKNYNLDIKLVGFERGMIFSQTKMIFRDGSVKEEVKEFVDWNDWMWNAILPNNGG